ncbi:MAG: hypothetical protein ACW986_09235 [Promethearchaeota archaeon]|jgi:hypothetical protein
MEDLNKVPEFSRYFRVISPTEIKINKDEIFYRDKYNDIITYIKSMATFDHDTVLEEYLSPKGAILINVNPGTDIEEFIKLISMNYYLEFIELRINEIRKEPEKFLKDFPSIIKAIGSISLTTPNTVSKEDSLEEPLSDSEQKIERRLILINQHIDFKEIFKGVNFLHFFFNMQNDTSLNFINSNSILIWVNNDIQDIVKVSSHLFTIFDLFIKVPLLGKIERETVYRDFFENNPKIVFDVNALVNSTENWEIKDITQLLKIGIFKHFLNSELNDTSNEITHLLLGIIESGEFLPSYSPNNSLHHQIDKEIENSQHDLPLNTVGDGEKVLTIRNSDEYLNHIRDSRMSDFMLGQLYENAAFLNYNELILVIDKLDKKEPLEENDRVLLAKYPFILNYLPKTAQINLEKAKKRVDRIKQAFGK